MHSELTALLLLAQERSGPLLERLDPLTRTRVLAALLGLVLVLLALVGLSWLGFRFVRRYMTAWDAEPTPAELQPAAKSSRESAWRDEPANDGGRDPSSGPNPE